MLVNTVPNTVILGQFTMFRALLPSGETIVEPDVALTVATGNTSPIMKPAMSVMMVNFMTLPLAM